jgi:hypothetical protein
VIIIYIIIIAILFNPYNHISIIITVKIKSAIINIIIVMITIVIITIVIITIVIMITIGIS